MGKGVQGRVSDLCPTVTRKVFVVKLRAFSQAFVHRAQMLFFF